MLAITNSGAVKIWMLTGYENRVLIIYRNICTNITYKHHMNVFDKIWIVISFHQDCYTCIYK